MKWIRAKRKLPRNFEWVLVTSLKSDKKCIGITRWTGDEWEGEDCNTTLLCYTDRGFIRIKIEDISHWMPIPDPPEYCPYRSKKSQGA